MVFTTKLDTNHQAPVTTTKPNHATSDERRTRDAAITVLVNAKPKKLIALVTAWDVATEAERAQLHQILESDADLNFADEPSA